ncbi:MAG: glycosyltransferase family 4 protein [Syntrophomonadaceae bacterium]|nr:glycosyltransferase family 4 protein [Syntrophomonadaceae bacterium]
MRIGVFSDSYRPYTSGVVTSICTFNEELSKLGHETFIFAPSYRNYRDEEENVFRIFSVPSPSNPGYTLAVPLSPRVNRIVKTLNLDVVHVHSPFILGQIGASCSRRLGIPLVFTYHTLYDQYVHYVPVAQEIAREWANKYISSFSNRCDLVITPSLEIKKMIQSKGIKTPIEVIPTGVETRKFEKGDPTWLRRRYNIPPERKICLFVGRLSREKNIDFLLQAFQKIKAEYNETCLVIVATGPLEKELKKMVINLGLALNEDVIFTGFLPEENLVDAYCGADIFIFASVTETQGIVLVEAMAAGLPLVVVKATGSQEMVEHERQGMVVDYDLDVFARQVLHLLRDDELRKRFSAAAVKRASELSSRAMARKMEQQYLQVIEQGHANRSRHLFAKWRSG